MLGRVFRRSEAMPMALVDRASLPEMQADADGYVRFCLL